jgi:hypothetical protein
MMRLMDLWSLGTRKRQNSFTASDGSVKHSFCLTVWFSSFSHKTRNSIHLKQLLFSPTPRSHEACIFHLFLAVDGCQRLEGCACAGRKRRSRIRPGSHQPVLRLSQRLRLPTKPLLSQDLRLGQVFSHGILQNGQPTTHQSADEGSDESAHQSADEASDPPTGKANDAKLFLPIRL